MSRLNLIKSCIYGLIVNAVEIILAVCVCVVSTNNQKCVLPCSDVVSVDSGAYMLDVEVVVGCRKLTAPSNNFNTHTHTQIAAFKILIE